MTASPDFIARRRMGSMVRNDPVAAPAARAEHYVFRLATPVFIFDLVGSTQDLSAQNAALEAA